MKYSINNNKGMTLVEVLLAIFIGTLIFIAITSVYFLGQRYYRVGNNRMEIVQNGRVTIDRLTREIRQTEEIVTALPQTKEEVGFPPPAEIEFQDGHQTEIIRYFRYFLNDTQLKRQIIVYYFVGYEDDYVNWNAVGESGEDPIFLVLEERLVGEFFNSLQFYGSGQVYVEAGLAKESATTNFKTLIYGRNTQ